MIRVNLLLLPRRIHVTDKKFSRTYRRAVRRKANLEDPDEEKPISPEKGQKCAHTMAFFGRNWLFLVRVKKLAFLRTARRISANLYPSVKQTNNINERYWYTIIL